MEQETCWYCPCFLTDCKREVCLNPVMFELLERQVATYHAALPFNIENLVEKE